MKSAKLDREQIRRLYEQHGRGLIAYACTFLPGFASAEDVLHQVFERLLRGGIEIEGSPVPYLFRAVRNAALNDLRSRARVVDLDETKEGAIYHLLLTKNAPMVRPAEDSSPAELRIGRYSGKRTMAQLAQYLGGIVARPVIDRTGLSGTFDIHFEFTPDFVPIGPNGPLADPNGPSIFTALQEQLGLKLEPARGPVDTLFIDEAQRPAPN